jgi:peptidoglycan hydrolase-like protein with peptidoglycan-binding domain
MIRGTVKFGSKGVDVEYIQGAMNSLGFNAGGADGIFGSGTQKAVQAFQTSNGLVADGIVGPATYSAIDSAMKGKFGSAASSVVTTSSGTTIPASAPSLTKPSIPKASDIMSKIKGYYKNPAVLYGVPTVIVLAAFAYYMSSKSKAV